MAKQPPKHFVLWEVEEFSEAGERLGGYSFHTKEEGLKDLRKRPGASLYRSTWELVLTNRASIAK